MRPTNAQEISKGLQLHLFFAENKPTPIKEENSSKLNNPLLLKISFRTLRHWKAKLEYHPTKDVMQVKDLLGHRKFDTAMMGIHIAEGLFTPEPDAFTVKVAKTEEEITVRPQVGFEWVGEKDVQVFLSKRK